MEEQMVMTEVLAETAVAKAKKETLVEFYVYLRNEQTGVPFSVNWVTYASKAKALAAACRLVGMRCGYNYDFAGKKMSTPAQRTMAFTVIAKATK